MGGHSSWVNRPFRSESQHGFYEMTRSAVKSHYTDFLADPIDLLIQPGCTINAIRIVGRRSR
jgi:hypothetical protein